MAGSVVVPLLTRPSLITVSICGVTAQATYPESVRRAWCVVRGNPLRVIIGMNRAWPAALTPTVNGPAGVASSTRPETPVTPGAGTSSMQ